MLRSMTSRVSHTALQHLNRKKSSEKSGPLEQIVVVALLFYVHGKHLRSCRDGQLT